MIKVEIKFNLVMFPLVADILGHKKKFNNNESNYFLFI